MTLECFSGQRIHGDLGRLADLNVDDVGLVHLHLRGHDAHVRQGHQRGAFGVLDAFHHRLTLANGLVGHDAVKGGDGDGPVEQILVEAQAGYLGLQVPALGIGIGLGLVETRHGLCHRGYIEVVGRLFSVKILLGHDAVFVEGLGALPVKTLLFQIGLGVLDVGLSGLFRGNVGANVGPGGGDGGLLAFNVRLLLHVLDGGDRLALLHRVSLFDIEVGDAAHSGSSQVDVGLGLDLAGAADDRGQVLLDQLGGQNFGVTRLLLVNEQGHKSGGHHYGENDQEYFFHVRFVLQVSPNISLRNYGRYGSQRLPKFSRRQRGRSEAARGGRLDFPEGKSRPHGQREEYGSHGSATEWRARRIALAFWTAERASGSQNHLSRGDLTVSDAASGLL